MQKIYFGSTALIITTSNHPEFNGLLIENGKKETVLNALKNLQNTSKQTLVLIEPTTEKALEEIKEDFMLIQAAGGLAYTPNDEILLIFRRGKWDLPKGKLDDGEDLETCAVREVEEETGLKGVVLNNLIQLTYHTYQEDGKDILKETFWYKMRVEKQELQPQTEEDIEECRWVAKQDLVAYFSNMQPSVKDVIETFLAA